MIKINRLSLKVAQNKITMEVVNTLPVIQLELWHDAFVNGGQPGEKWKPLKPIGSYRDGGQPLRNTGQLKRAANLLTDVSSNTANSEFYSKITCQLPYAKYQQTGFKSNGPNFIPLTLKAVRNHIKGGDPKKEGLVKGKDYIMAWHGVTVPARPIIDYSDTSNQEKIKKYITKIIMEK